MSDGKWQTVAPKKPRKQVTEMTTTTGKYKSSFVAGGIKSSDPTYKRSNSVGDFTQIFKKFSDGTSKTTMEKRNRVHVHFKTDDTVHTMAHTPTQPEIYGSSFRGGTTFSSLTKTKNK